jgi:ABC-type uncharacterized transport system permease subunit
MPYRITRSELQITLDRINEAFKAKWPSAATLTLVRYQGRGYELRAVGENFNKSMHGAPSLLNTREMSIYLDGILAGLSL